MTRVKAHVKVKKTDTKPTQKLSVKKPKEPSLTETEVEMKQIGECLDKILEIVKKPGIRWYAGNLWPTDDIYGGRLEAEGHTYEQVEAAVKMGVGSGQLQEWGEFGKLEYVRIPRKE